ncbi:cyclic pyranopterin monophosphate synthase MoaC [Arthrobacter sp. H14-L1]|nr:cyclic pyranopterin monophosphate synthase MoaC [Arthrobacter sp. H14-L1]MCY0904711.1 cyclic pyranopterin monophosphate synthase MoaC [Arthrobacter sp. H14-L1]
MSNSPIPPEAAPDDRQTQARADGLTHLRADGLTQSRADGLTHLRADGTAQMVDVSGKPETTRQATAQAVVTTTAAVMALLGAGELPKGDALAVARVAGIMAAKKTPELIPLCHPLPISKVTVDFELSDSSITVQATVKTRSVTGVEMEALTAASVAALSVYDMIKAVDKHAVITDIRVLAKSGGKSGDWAL